VNSLEGNGKCHRFRLRQNDSMKKLIEKYAEMEDVIADGVQLIFKGNPISSDDTPAKLQITSEDTLEVCKVPGIFGKRKKPEIEKTSVITEMAQLPILSLNNNRLASSGSPSSPKRPRHSSESESRNSASEPQKPRNFNAGLNLEMLNQPSPMTHLNELKTKFLNNTSSRDSNSPQQPNLDAQKSQISLKRITELEFELGHQKLKNKDLTHLVQMLNAKFILAQRALEEKELLLKQKDKNIEHLNTELERRERILLAYSAVASSKQNVPPSQNVGSRVSPPSAGASSTGSSSSHQINQSTSQQESTTPTVPSMPHPQVLTGAATVMPILPATTAGPSWK
jgi:hypothetical protein